MKQIILKYVRQRGDDIIPYVHFTEYDEEKVEKFVKDVISVLYSTYKSKMTIGVKIKDIYELEEGQKYEFKEFVEAPEYGKYAEFDQKILKKAVKHGNAEKGIKYWIDETIKALIEELSKFNPKDLLNGEEKPKPAKSLERQVVEAQQSIQDKRQRREYNKVQAE